MPSVSVRLATGKLPFTVTEHTEEPPRIEIGNCDVCPALATFRQAMLHECHVFARVNGRL